MRQDAIDSTSDTVKSVETPFTVVIDTREQLPYDFLGLRAGFARNNPPAVVKTMRVGLPNGDYSLFGHPSIAIERKSKEDLYGSVARRTNFVGRLERMSELCNCGGYSAVVVEAEFIDLIQNPPSFSRLHPRSLSRTLIAWSMRYPVRWWYVRGRDAGELLTYRLLERWWIDRSKGSTAQDSSLIDEVSTHHEDTTDQG